MNSLPAISIIFFGTVASSMCEAPQVSTKPANCLTDGSGTQGICALSNIKRVELEVTLDPKGNSALKSLRESSVNPSDTIPENYLVIRAIDNQSGASWPVKAGVDDAGEKDGKQIVHVHIEILEEATVRQSKIQAFVNQTKAQDLAARKASQKLVDKVTEKNAEVVKALDEYAYVENRVGRFKLSAEYHSTQSGAWTGTVTSPEVVVDVVNKGSGFTALQTP